MLKAVGALALCGALLTVPAPALAGSKPQTNLRIMVAVKDTDSRTATLTCVPPGGSHRSPREACRLLRRAGGDPARLNVHPGAVCTREYRPTAVVVTGRWRGKPVWFGRTYSNPCEAKAEGGAVFSL